MRQKTVKKYLYEGLGFAIELINVQMRLIHNEWHPIIDVKKIADIAIKKMIFQNERFSGNQIKFIRTYFAMSLREFAKEVVRESHTSVAKWEKCGNNVTNMDINIEIMLRLYMYDKSCAGTPRQQNAFYKQYHKLISLPFSSNPVHLSYELLLSST